MQIKSEQALNLILSRHISDYGVFIYETDEKLSYRFLSDVPCWTGSLLGALAYRYAVLNEKPDIDIIKRLLAGIDFQLSVASRNLPRSIAKYGMSDEFSTYLGEHGFKWAGDCSRDQYTGLLWGLSKVIILVKNDKVIKQALKLLNELLLNVRFGKIKEKGKTTKHGKLNSLYMAAFMYLGYRYLGKYKKEYNRYKKKAKFIIWATRFLKYQDIFKINRSNPQMTLWLLDILGLAKDKKRIAGYYNGENNCLFNALAGNKIDKETLEQVPIDRNKYKFSFKKQKKPVEMKDRCHTAFVWKDNPFKKETNKRNRNRKLAPVDFLLAYYLDLYNNKNNV